MNIDLHNLTIVNAVMHTIKRKEDGASTATPEYENELLHPTPDIVGVIKKRLISAMGKASKAFQLDILHDHSGSFYSLVEEMRQSSNDDEFMGISRLLASILAASQTTSGIPGGYLLVLNCLESGKKIVIVIKAEPHEALIKQPGETQLTFLSSVFLSPSQKLYKIGMLSDKAIFSGNQRDSLDKNEQYDAFLFDDQFRIKNTPAEYFYKDFLGFTISENAKIQSQKFYEMTEKFIRDSFEDPDTKSDLLRVLRDEFKMNQSASIIPTDFADEYFPVEQAEAYKEEIIFSLPSSIIKDPVLIRNRISRSRVDFPGQIILSGPDEEFSERVKIISGGRVDEVLDFDGLPERYTFVRIAGRPYSND